MLIFHSGFAQEKNLKGKVVSANGAGIQGVTVQEKGTHTFTTTDADGNYSIRISKPGAMLVFSYIGFTTRETPAGDGEGLDITLTESDKQLNEVVVTALGIKKEVKKLGYAVQEIKGSELTKARDINPINSLEGKVAGLSVGASAEMLGRPQLVLRGSTDLLFVVDGIPINSDTWNISPDDVESYTILKGANAAALYGFRGQNGAIIITTKRGTRDKKGWNVDFNSSNMLETSFLTEPKAQAEYGRGSKFVYSYGDVLYDNGQRLQEYGPRFEGQAVKQYDSPYDPVTGKRTPTPWLARGKDNFHKFMENGFITTDNISLSTSGSNFDIRMSLSHSYQKGMAPNTRLNGDNLNLSAGYNLSPRLRLEANVNASVQYSPNVPDVDYGPNSYIYMFKVYGSSDYDINDLKDIYKGPTGVPNLVQYAQEYGRENSAWFMAKKWMRTHNKLDLYGYVKMTYKFSDNLNLSLRSSATTWDILRTEKVPASANLNTYLPWYYFGWYGDYRQDHRNLLENNTDLLLSYDKKFGSWNFSANAGGSFRSYQYTSTWGTTKDLAIPNLYTLSNTINPGLNYSFDSRMQVYSAYYSFDIGYKNYFTLTNTGRMDNLSTLPNGHNTFFYPSVSLSTVISDYTDLPSAISFLKLRASFADVKGGLTQSVMPSSYKAVTGNDLNGGLLGYGTEYYTTYDGPSYTNQNQYTITSYVSGLPAANFTGTLANPALKPFDKQSYEGGLDIRFLKNRLGLDVTYFQSIDGPQIFATGIPSSTGFTNKNVNGLTSMKKGWEIALSGSPVKNPKGFSWDILATWSTFKETLKDIYANEPDLPINGHVYQKGERLDAFYSTKFVRDGSGNIVYSGGAPLQSPGGISNNGFIGYLNPDFAFGINNRVTYRNFFFSFQFDGRIGGKIYDRVLYQGNNAGTSSESASGDFGIARRAEWEVAKANGGSLPSAYPGAYVGKGKVIVSGTPHYTGGQIDNLKDLTFADNQQATTVQSFLSSGIGGNFDEYYMFDRSFVKLREVNLGYTFSDKFLKSRLIKSASISLVGRNLLYFAKRTDFDIDQYASGFNITDRTVGGTSSTDLQSATGRRIGINLNVSF